MDQHAVVGAADVLFVTFDSLRYDVAVGGLAAGRTPNLAGWIGASGWEKRETPGTFTLPAHLAYFHGFGPTPADAPGAPRLWALDYQGSRTIGPRTYRFTGVTNVIEGFASLGYLTLCIGGVGFFDRSTPLGSVLPGFFAESVWDPSMGVEARESTAAQAAWGVRRIAAVPADQRVFLFVNISATHVPHRMYVDDPDATESVRTQTAALAYADAALAPLIDALAARGPLFGVLTADHGEAYGEDGRWGHRIPHPTVTTVPYAEFTRGLWR